MLSAKRESILRDWIDSTFSTYPQETANVLRKTRDPFGNPVGATIAGGLEGLLVGLLEGASEEVLRSHLDPILKIRSVQGFAPSAAVSFVFRLRDIVRQAVPWKEQSASGRQELQSIEAGIERLGMMAFDSYVGFREEIYDLRVREAKRQVSWLLRKAGIGTEALESEQEPR